MNCITFGNGETRYKEAKGMLKKSIGTADPSYIANI